MAAFDDVVQSWYEEASASDTIQALEKLREEYAGFEKDGLSENARQRYDELLAQLQSSVEAEYGKTWDDYLVKDVDGVEDTELLSATVTKLEEFIRQLDDDEKALGKAALTTKYRSLATEHLAQCQARIEAIAEAKRKAEEEAKRKAEEEARKKAEEEAARNAASHYENQHFALDFPAEWEGKWAVGIRHATDYGVTYFVNVSGVANNPSGGGGDSVVVACGGEPLSNPMNKYVGTLSNGRCDVYVRHEFGFPFIGESSGMGAAQLTLK